MVSHDIEKLSRLPTLPTVAVEILRAIGDPNVTVNDLLRLIEADPALTGKVLAAANSVRFGIGRPIGSLQRAGLLLGKRVIGALALGFALAAASMQRGPESPYYKRQWLQAFTHALAAKTLAERFGGCLSDEAFSVGLVARVGRLALIKHAFQEYRECLQQLERTSASPTMIEREHLGITSHELTCRIFRQWKLPESFEDAISNDVDLLEDDEPGLGTSMTPVQSFLQAGGRVADFIGAAQRGGALVRLHESMAALTENVEDEVEWLLGSVTQQLQANATLFQIDLAGIGGSDELLSEATEQLMRLTLDSTGIEVGEESSTQHLLAENGELRRKVEQLARESETDPLTQLYNRRWFHRRLQEALDRSYVQRTTTGLLLGDIDGFKQINDTYGHPVGDLVLQEVARTLERTLRSGDLLARYGGEEFAILAEFQTLERVQTLAERLRLAVQSTVVTTPVGELRVTISLGGILGRPTGDVNDFESRLLGEADRCLYEAKALGRNRAVCRQLDPHTREARPFLIRPASADVSNASWMPPPAPVSGQ